jgi:hypothetical protein
MSNKGRPPRPVFNLHGYHPIVIDEKLLTSEDREDERRETMSRPPWERLAFDWQECFTADERTEYERLLNAPPRNSMKWSEKRLDEVGTLARTARHRWYARRAYNNGCRVWWGDGVPQKKTAGNSRDGRGCLSSPTAGACAATS